MGDPFEQPTTSPETATTAPSTEIREASVQQAVVFLSDPRVRGADLNKAAAFLRSKGVTEDEIRQAFARSALVYPPPHSNSTTLPSSNFPPNSVYFPTAAAHGGIPTQPPPKSSSWWPLLLGVAAAAAVYSAGREILAQYVVPLYFPDAARDARGGSSGGEIPSSTHGSRHTDGRPARANDDEIARLTERVDALTELSRRTTDSMERLAQTVEAAREKNDRSAVAITELRDAIRLLSQSISASRGARRDAFGNEQNGLGVGGQSSSVAVIDTSSVMADDDRERDGFKDSRRSSLREPFEASNNRKMGILAYGTSAASSMAGTNESTYASNRTERPSVDRSEVEHDDFLSMAPAEIQDDWRCIGRGARPLNERESYTSAKSGGGACGAREGDEEKDADAVKQENEIEQVVGEVPARSDRSFTSANASSQGVEIAHVSAEADSPNGGAISEEKDGEDINVDENGGSTWDKMSRDSDTQDITKDSRYGGAFDGNSPHDYDRATHGMGNSGGRGIAAARMLFEADILAETRGLFGQTGAVTGSGGKTGGDRPVSMPAMDAPLSDVE